MYPYVAGIVRVSVLEVVWRVWRVRRSGRRSKNRKRTEDTKVKSSNIDHYIINHDHTITTTTLDPREIHRKN